MQTAPRARGYSSVIGSSSRAASSRAVWSSVIRSL